MAKVYLISETDPDGKYAFVCPGCKRHHHVPTKGAGAWSFNGNLSLPSFSPSIHSYYDGPNGTKEKVCHSFVTEGNIQFLGDCFHELKGQTVELNEIS